MKHYFSEAKIIFLKQSSTSPYSGILRTSVISGASMLYFFRNNCKKLDVMTWQQMEDTFYNCLDFCEMYDRLPYFYITGGDPILHPDFWKLLGLMKERDIPFTILGNPFHLNDEVCQKLREYGCQKYQLSLDGMRATHDWFRRRAPLTLPWRKLPVSKGLVFAV